MSATRKIRRGSKRSNRKYLTLSERINVIKQSDKTPSFRELSILFKCSVTQIKNILRRKGEYLEEFKNNGNVARIKRRQSARFLTVGVIICEWIYRMTRKGEGVSDDDIMVMAKKVGEQLNMTEVRPNNNWLERMRMKFNISEPELEEISLLTSSFEESLKIEDIIQDLRSSCQRPDMLTSSLAFPYEVTRRYLKKTVDDDRDISKVRMKSCLEEAKGDKYLAVDGICQQTGEVERNEIYDTLSYYEDDELITVKTEIMDASTDSHQSGYTENSISMLNETQKMEPAVPNVCIKQEALTKGIKSYKEACNILGPMEQFALAQEDVRAIGLINQLENHYRDMMLDGKM